MRYAEEPIEKYQARLVKMPDKELTAELRQARRRLPRAPVPLLTVLEVVLRSPNLVTR